MEVIIEFHRASALVRLTFFIDTNTSIKERGDRTMIIIHAKFNVDSTKQQAFLNEIQPLISGSRKENGNVSYDLYKDTERENVYTMVEIWENAESVANHNASEHFTSFVAKAKQFLTAPLDIKAFDGQPLKG